MKNRTNFALSAMLTISALAPIAGARGDLEVFCERSCDPVNCFTSGCSFFPVQERWPAASLVSMPWTLVVDTGGDVVPGLDRCPGEYDACTQNPSVALNEYSLGFYSVRMAMDEWSFTEGALESGGDPCSIPTAWGLENLVNFQECPTVSTVTPGQGAGAGSCPAGTGNLNSGDGQYVISFHEPACYFYAMGGPTALAVTSVAPGAAVPAPGGYWPTVAYILDADIAVNVLSTNAAGTQLSFGWIEQNLATGLSHQAVPSSAQLGGSVLTSNVPEIGYADIQGVVTHELGHFLGFGHTLVDSRGGPRGTLFPTMFFEAQVQPYTDTVVTGTTCAGGTPSYSTEVANGPATLWGGLAGVSARTLERDDIAALRRGYSTASLGGIRGTVTRFDGLNFVPVEGVSVVAIRADCPARERAGTFTSKLGSYDLTGLPAGDYYVYAEEVDQDPGCGATPGASYFPWGGVPNYMDAATLLCPPPSCASGRFSCVQATGFPVGVQYEVYNSADAAAELPQAASLVTVSEGVIQSGIDIVGRLGYGTTANGAVALSATPDGVNHSYRGMRVTVAQCPTPLSCVQLRVQYSAADHGGKTLRLWASRELQTTILNGQLFQLNTGQPGLMGFVDVQLSSGSGVATVPLCNVVDCTLDHAFKNVFLQGVVIDPTAPGQVVLTNPVNVWVEARN